MLRERLNIERAKYMRIYVIVIKLLLAFNLFAIELIFLIHSKGLNKIIISKLDIYNFNYR